MTYQYAVFQAGSSIFGISTSGHGALEEAMQWAEIDEDKVDELQPDSEIVDGRFYAAPISDKLASAVYESGGHAPYEIIDGWLVDPSEV